MTIKVTKRVHSQMMVVNILFNALYTFLNAHKIGLQSNLSNCYLFEGCITIIISKLF